MTSCPVLKDVWKLRRDRVFIFLRSSVKSFKIHLHLLYKQLFLNFIEYLDIVSCLLLGRVQIQNLFLVFENLKIHDFLSHIKRFLKVKMRSIFEFFTFIQEFRNSVMFIFINSDFWISSNILPYFECHAEFHLKIFRI